MANSIVNKSIFTFFSIVMCTIVFFAILTGAYYFSDKGFEMSDEGFYLYFTEFIKPNVYVTQNFGFLNKIACLWHPTLINLRLAKFICQTISVFIFVFSLIKYLNSKGILITSNFKLLIYLTVVISSYVNYDYLPMTMSYNTWSLILSLFGFSILLIQLSSSEKKLQILMAVAMGFIIFGLFLVKIPNAFFLVFIYLLIALLYNRKFIIIKVFAFILGVIISFLILLHDVNHLFQILNNYKVALFEIKQLDTISYSKQLIEFLKQCKELGYLNYLLAISILTGLIYKFNTKKNTALKYLPIVINFAVGFMFFEGNSKTLYNDFIVGSILLINGVIYISLNYTKKSLELIFSQANIIAVILIITPFLLMIGTNNSFYYTTSQALCFSLAGMIILVLNNSKMDQLYFPLQSLYICLFILLVIYNGAIKYPYRQNNLLEKKYPIHFNPSIDGIYENYERFVDYTCLNLITNKLSPSKSKVLTFFNYFGLYYLTNKNMSPECPISDGEQYIEGDKYVLNREKIKNSAELIVVPSTVHLSSKFHKMFEEYGINLGVNYTMVYSYTFLSTNEIVYFYKKIQIN